MPARYRIIFASIIVVGIVIFVAAMGSAPASSPPEWTGFAGKANHACYHHKGVLQLFGRTGGGGGYSFETDVVCRDGWAVNIYNDTNYFP